MLISACLALTSSPQVAGQTFQGGSVERAPQTLFAVANPQGSHDLWLVPESGRGPAARLALTGVALQPLHLVGYALKDELRLDLPTPDRRLVPHVSLPGGGALFRVLHGGASALLCVSPAGEPRVVLELPGADSLADRAHVSRSGRWAAIATSGAAAGDVWVVDLAGELGASCATPALPPLGVQAASVRVSEVALFFLADGEVHRAAPGGEAQPVAWSLASDEQPLDELLLAAGGGHLAVVTETEDEERRLFVVGRQGPAKPIMAAPIAMEAVGLYEDLGPWVAISPDGRRVAWIGWDGTSRELFARELDQPGDLHLTSDPDFPAYVDNVGVVDFATSDQLCAVAGDVKLSTAEDEMIGAAEMYAACFEGGGVIEWMNLTLTNGQHEPPFTAPASMVVGRLWIDPLGERALIVGEAEETETEVTCFRTDGVPGDDGDNLMVLLSQLEDETSLARVGDHVLFVVEPEDADQPELHLLRPLGTKGAPLLQAIAAFPGNTLVDRFSAGGARASFAATWSGVERIWGLELATGAAWDASGPQTSGSLSPAVATTRSGELRFGLGFASQPQYVSVAGPGSAAVLGLPSATGFPIPLR